MSARFEAGTFTPAPGRGPLGRMLATQVALETKLALRQGEQVLLTLIIPLALLVGLSLLEFVPLPEPRVDSALATVLALAVMSTAFTSQAISLGFDRRYGVLRRLAATAVPRSMIVLGRLGGMAAVVLVQVVVQLLPSGALAEGLRTALLGGTPALGHIVVLIVWAVVSGGIATRTVRWT
jgi:ABC-2 type transport system permease protein